MYQAIVVRILCLWTLTLTLGCGRIWGTVSYYQPGGSILGQMVFTNSAYAINTWTCSGVATIQAQDNLSQPLNVTSPTVITLTGTGGMTFYSDPGCTTQITSVTINTGQNSASVYLTGSKGGVQAAVASNIRFNNGTQNETFTISPFTWLGGTSGNWNLGLNWQGGVVPNSTKNAIFDNNCITFCNVVTNGFSPDVGTIALKSTFTGALTQTAGDTLTVENGFTQAGGTFNGSSNLADTMVLSGDFNLSGGTFNAPAGTLQFVSTNFTISHPSSFVHQNGTLLLGTGSSGDPAMNFNTGTTNFYHFFINLGGNFNSLTITGSINVVGPLDLQSFEMCLLGNINSYGNVAVGGGGSSTQLCGYTDGGMITLVGSSGQIVTGGAAYYFPGITMSGQAGENITFNGQINITGNFIYNSGVIVYNSTPTTFGTGSSSDPGQTINIGSLVLNDVSLLSHTGSSNGGTLNIVGTLFVGGNLILSMSSGDGSNTLGGQTISVAGNFTEPFSPGNVTLQNIIFTGAGANTFNDASGAFLSGTAVTVNKPGGSLTLNSNMVANSGSQPVTIQSGTLVLNGKTLNDTGSTVTVNAGATLSCSGGCAAPNPAACGLGLNKLKCATLINGGTIN